MYSLQVIVSHLNSLRDDVLKTRDNSKNYYRLTEAMDQDLTEAAGLIDRASWKIATVIDESDEQTYGENV